MFLQPLNRSWPVLVLTLVFTAVTTTITWAEHETYNSTSLDMAVYAQAVWNTANGHPFETTLLLKNRLHLAEHFALLLLPLAPLYGLLADVRMLLLVQQLGLAVSGLAVFWLARRRVGQPLALVLLGCYYAMPTLGEVALDAFYPVAFAAIPLGWSAALALDGRARAAAPPALLAVLIEEEAALVAVGVGIYLALFSPAARRIGATTFLAGGLWLVLAVAFLMPSFTQPGRSGAETRLETHFEELRAKPLSWLGAVVATRLEPDLLRLAGWPASRQQPTCPQIGQCSAARWWLYPTGGLPLLAPASLVIAAPPAAALLLADKPGRFRRHWAAPMLPLIWLSAALGLARLATRPRLRLVGAGFVVVATLLMYRLDGSLPLGSQYEADDVVWKPAGADLSRLASTVPDGSSVAASRRGLAHLANRRQVYVFPTSDYGEDLWPPTQPPTYVLLDLTNEATTRELNTPGGEFPLGVAYREVERTPNALMLRTGF